MCILSSSSPVKWLISHFASKCNTISLQQKLHHSAICQHFQTTLQIKLYKNSRRVGIITAPLVVKGVCLVCFTGAERCRQSFLYWAFKENKPSTGFNSVLKAKWFHRDGLITSACITDMQWHDLIFTEGKYAWDNTIVHFLLRY